MKSVLSSRSESRGFTLIELLVVIAIIGILSSVVLASLNTARSKGTDAKIQSQMRSIAVNAELYYDSNGNSNGAASTCDTGMFDATTPTNIQQIMDDLQGITGAMTCGSNGTAYAVSKVLTSTTSKFCIDSTGNALITSATIADGATVCP